MRTIARRVGKTVLVIALLYGFMVLGSTLWLRDRLTPAIYAQNLTCWSRYNNLVSGPEKYRLRPGQRDWLVLYAAMPPYLGGGPAPSIGWRLRASAIYHVYVTYWPEVDRAQLYEDVASRMRPCGTPRAT